MEYDDDYPTCESTFATLRLYHPSASPELVTQALSLEPTDSQLIGEINASDKKNRPFKLSGWFFSSESHTDSKDLRRHIDGILWRLRGKKDSLAKLRTSNWRMDISCYWRSRSGHGGPTLSPEQMQKLGDLGIEIWFDVYFDDAPVLDSKGNVVTPIFPRQA